MNNERRILMRYHNTSKDRLLSYLHTQRQFRMLSLCVTMTTINISYIDGFNF